MSRKRPRLICLALDEETANHLDNMAMRRFTSRSEIMRELIRKEAKFLDADEDERREREIPIEVCIALLRYIDVNDRLKALVQALLERGYAKIERHENGYVFRIEPVFFAFLKKFNVEHETNYVIEDVYNTLVKLIRVVNADVKANVAIPILP
jgi:Arc/MetJ-type ribon-helix-helix transcriptional regulator